MSVKVCPKCGKSLKNNDSCTFCHIVPKVYQKKWSKNKKTIFYFDKELNPVTQDDRGLNPYCPLNGGNVSNYIGEWDYYILSSEDISVINQDYTAKELENYFSNIIENEWNNVYELFCTGNGINITTSIEQHFKSHGKEVNDGHGIIGVRSKDLDGLDYIFNDMKAFICLQKYRRYENVIDGIEKSISDNERQLMQQLNKSEIKKEVALDLLSSCKYKRQLWLKFLLDCKSNSTSALSIFRDYIDSKFSPIAIFSPDDTKYILSDNPVLFNASGKICSNIADGWYIPITPNILLLYADLTNWRKDNPEIQSNDMILVRGTTDFVKYYNKVLLDNSISKVGFMDREIANHIDMGGVISKDCFDNMMGIKN